MIRGAIPRSRKSWALLAAGVSDLVQVLFLPVFVEGAASPFEVALDATTALVIVLIMGFRWRLAIALAAELIPGVDLFPTWTAMVLSMPVEEKALPPAPTTPEVPENRDLSP